MRRDCMFLSGTVSFRASAGVCYAALRVSLRKGCEIVFLVKVPVAC